VYDVKFVINVDVFRYRLKVVMYSLDNDYSITLSLFTWLEYPANINTDG